MALDMIRCGGLLLLVSAAVVWTSVNAASVPSCSGKCSYKGECVDVDATKQDGCFTYKCIIVGNTIYLDTISEGCAFNNNCVDVAASVLDGCTTKTCTKTAVGNMNYYELKATTIKCSLNGNCVPPSHTYVTDCKTYECQQTGYFSMTKIGCSFNGTCVDAGDTVLDGCITKTCTVTQDGNMYYRSLKATTVQCELNGNCVPLDYTYVKNCYTYECQQYYSTGWFNIIKTECLRHDTRTECVGHGESYTFNNSGYSSTCTCTVSGYAYSVNCV